MRVQAGARFQLLFLPAVYYHALLLLLPPSFWWDHDDHAELIDVRAVGDNTYWAVGGVISSSDLTATFYVSTDNGNSWKQDTTIDNYFAVGIDCNVAASSYTCWAVLQDSNSNTWVASASS